MMAGLFVNLMKDIRNILSVVPLKKHNYSRVATISKVNWFKFQLKLCERESTCQNVSYKALNQK